jgi:hypothetical protein
MKGLKLIYVSLRTYRRDKHTNRSYGEKETTTVRFTLYEKKKTIGFIYFNLIKHVQDILEKYLD